MKNKFALLLVLFCGLSTTWIVAQDFSKITRKEGFVPFYLDEEKGKIYLEIPFLDKEILYVNALTAGVGSNDIGLDRGQLGDTRIVEFRKTGNKILMVHKNYDYRAYTSNPNEAKSIRDAFAESTLWGFEVIKSEGNTHIVEATNFFLQDAHGVSETLASTKQGNYRVEASRSGLYLPTTKNFPKNTEVEATITFTGTGAGGYLRSVTPSPEAVTVRMRHSFIELPPLYATRAFDPRAGYFYISYQDYTTPIDQPLVKRFISRHRLEKKDPSAAVSEVVEPIVYYLDRGTPEPVASALIEGGNWWAQAFEAAGFKNAFRVELAPEGMDLMDVRYHVIQWIHRSTRGWSYGSSIRDPRTGEIIKGQVSLGSLRVRQDYLIGQGLLQPFEEGNEADPKLMEFALNRLKQLSAHEIGHTLGISHSYATSASGRSSVMDYPHPLISLDENGEVDFSAAYDLKIGEWDKWAVTYGYGQPAPNQSEAEFLEKTLQATYAAGYEFITDSDSRNVSGVHPRSHLWDNGASASEELKRLLDLREKRMKTFGLNAIKTGEPEAILEEVFVPLYLMHRYQLEATSKLIGGLDYSYKVKGDNQARHKWLTSKVQGNALDALLESISTRRLEIPSSILELIPPRPYGYGKTRETFPSRTGPVFDPIAPAENVVDATFTFLFEPGRANRVYLQHLQNNSLPGLEEVLSKVSVQVFSNTMPSGLGAEIKLMTEVKLIDHLIALSKNAGASQTVRALARKQLRQLSTPTNPSSSLLKAHRDYLNQKIEAFLNLPEELTPQQVLSIPDGAPIGMEEMSCDFD